MNKDVIIDMVTPFLHDGAITYSEFDRLFDVLSLREQYSVADFLYDNGINLIDDEFQYQDEGSFFDSLDGFEFDYLKENKEEDETEETVTDDAEFKKIYEGVFKDSGHEFDDEETVVNTNIRQTNEMLCMLIQKGNKQAVQDLCVKNIGLVHKYASGYDKYYRYKLDFEDLEQAGFIGLLKAAYKFDTRFGAAFSTYAVFWIKQSILREIMDTGNTIRIPVHMMERITKVNRLLGKYYDLEPKERIASVAREAGLLQQDVEFCIMISKTYIQPASLNTPVGEEGDIELGELIPDSSEESAVDVTEYKDLQRNIRQVLDTLSDREKKVLILRFGLDDGRPRTLEEVGRQFGVTRERIRQIEAKAIKKLRHPSRSKKLKDFLE